MKDSTILGIVATVLAIMLGLALTVFCWINVYELSNFDYEEYFEEHGEYLHPESVGVDTFFARTFRNLGAILLAGGFFGLAGTLLNEKRPRAAFRLFVPAAILSFVSLFGLISMILFIITAVKISNNLGYNE